MNARYSTGYLLTTTSEVYRCSESGGMVVVATNVCNVNGSNRDFTVLHVPADETPDNKHAIHFDQQVTATTSIQYTEPIIIGPGESIHAKASSVDSVVVTMYIIRYADFLAGRF